MRPNIGHSPQGRTLTNDIEPRLPTKHDARQNKQHHGGKAMAAETSKVVSVKTNSRGIKYCLTSNSNGFEVWKLCENYCRQTKGGIRKTWRYVEKGMTLEAAEKLFKRRTK